MFSNEPIVGIGPCGYLILHPQGNIAFEAAGWYSSDALAAIEGYGGIRYLSCSHPHGMGALYQLQDHFHPEYVVAQREGIRFTKAFRVNYPFDETLQLYPGISMHYVGGHYEGHSVLYHQAAKLLFAGDALKFDMDVNGVPVAVSCHKAFHNQIPLTHSEVQKYLEVIGSFQFDHVFTPFEHVEHVTQKNAVCLFNTHLQGKPFVHPLPLGHCG